MTEKNQTDKKEEHSKLNWKKLLSNIKDLTLGALFIGMIMFAGIGAYSVFEKKSNIQAHTTMTISAS